MAELLRQPLFAGSWVSETLSWSNYRGRLLLHGSVGSSVTVEFQRCMRGRLLHAYPVGAHDIEIQVFGFTGVNALTDALAAVVTAVRASDPQCRRVIYAVHGQISPDGSPDALVAIAAAEAAGFRHVVDVDIAEGELSLFVNEPKWVTDVDIDLDCVPGT